MESFDDLLRPVAHVSRSYDHVPVSRGYMRAQYPLLMAVAHGSRSAGLMRRQHP